MRLRKLPPEYEEQARDAFQKAFEHAQDVDKVLDDIKAVFEDVSKSKELLSALTIEATNFSNAFKEDYQKIRENAEDIHSKEKVLNENIEIINTKISTVQNVFDKHPDINAEIESIENFLVQIEDVNGKSTQLLKTIAARKNEIDRLHQEIIGFKETNSETNEETYVPGIKDELQKVYEGTSEKLNALNSDFISFEEKSKENYEAFIKKSQEEKDLTFTQWETNFEAIRTKIQNLLPNALTAGLSHAFSEKKGDEVKSHDTHKTQFIWGIIGMICVSLIPVGISINFLMNDVSIEIVIDRLPRLVLAILPLYIPVLWLTISGSKKMNLSKRLIEEYSHKEVLSKTFEGLSSQIETIGHENVSIELRLALLDNFLEMYSQNPGRLISDYNNTDHPLMELLENANKLENSVERINKIPGMKKIAKILERKAKDKIAQAEERVENSIDKAVELVEAATKNE